MPTDPFNLSWFIIFILIIFIAFVGNTIIILSILRDKSMHTSTYFYIINVNIADIILVLSCVPERITAVFDSNVGFQLGMYTCYLLPFLQQVSMHAALGFLLILTVHRCYPAGVPRCLQRNAIRKQICNHSKTVCLIWLFAILINIPLFILTKYEEHPVFQRDNHTNLTLATCDTEARELWSRTYLILVLVLTYVITGVFLMVIYGQVIRMILNTKKYRLDSTTNLPNQYQFLSKTFLRPAPALRTMTSSTSSSNQPQTQLQRSSTTFRPSVLSQFSQNKSHSTQHVQVIVMVFIVILLYILLLLPYRLLNLLYIIYNEMFQYHFMNEIYFQCLLHVVRLLVFLNCALQPMICLIISSRLRQTVQQFLNSILTKFSCECQCILPPLNTHLVPQAHPVKIDRIINNEMAKQNNDLRVQQKQIRLSTNFIRRI